MIGLFLLVSFGIPIFVTINTILSAFHTHEPFGYYVISACFIAITYIPAIWFLRLFKQRCPYEITVSDKQLICKLVGRVETINVADVNFVRYAGTSQSLFIYLRYANQKNLWILNYANVGKSFVEQLTSLRSALS